MKSGEKKQKTLTQKFKVFSNTDEHFKNWPLIIFAHVWSRCVTWLKMPPLNCDILGDIP